MTPMETRPTPETEAAFIEEAKRWCESLEHLSDGEVCCKLADLLAGKHHAERERDEAREKRTWRPIESAPRDGTKIIGAWFARDGFLCASDAWFEEELGWRSEEGCIIPPTHWMPLPNPPEALAREGGGDKA